LDDIFHAIHCLLGRDTRYHRLARPLLGAVPNNKDENLVWQDIVDDMAGKNSEG